MRKTRLIAFVMALISMCLFGLLLIPGDADRSEDAAEPRVTVIAAACDIKAYTVIDQSLITVASVPQSAVHSNACLRVDQVLGCTSLADLAAGEVLLTNHILGPESIPTDLVLCIPEGYRAMSIAVSETTGLSGLLKVGDRVDVISVVGDLDPAHDDRAVSVTLVQDREILAIGQSLLDAPKDEDGAYTYKNVTLALRPEEVPKLAAAQYEGDLFLVLRPLQDSGTPDIRPFTMDRTL